MRRGLAHLRVIDLSSGIAAAYCAKLLAGAGADVVKVEPPGGDPWRAWRAGSAAGAPVDVDEGARSSASSTTGSGRCGGRWASRPSPSSSPVPTS